MLKELERLPDGVPHPAVTGWDAEPEHGLADLPHGQSLVVEAADDLVDYADAAGRVVQVHAVDVAGGMDDVGGEARGVIERFTRSRGRRARA